MACRRYQLGRFSYRRRRFVAALWVALLIALGISASTLSGAYSSQFSIPGTESQQAIDTLTTRFPQAGLALASANIVVAAPRGEPVDSPANKAALEAVLADVRQTPHVTSVLDPFETKSLSANRRIAVARATYDILPLDVSSEQQKALFATARAGTVAGLQVEYSGTAAQVKPSQGGLKELLGVVVAAIVLLVMFGSFAAAGLPLLTAFLGVGIGAAAITTLTGFVTLSNTTPVLGLMLGLAVGIDYALFIMSRYRDELLKGRDGEEAAGRAVATAGSAVVFAGLTVIIALVGMLTVNIPFLSYMGLGAAATVIIAVLVALTLLPAMLGFTGRKVLGRRKRASVGQSMGHRWAAFVARRPGTRAGCCAAGPRAAGDPGAVPEDGAARRGLTVEDGHQPAGVRPAVRGVRSGSNGPLVVVVEGSKAIGKQAAETVRTALAGIDGVLSVGAATRNPAGDTFLLSVVAKGSPASEQTKQLVSRIRATAGPLEQQTGTTIAVSGQTALQVDVASRLAGALPIYLLVVIGLAMVLLTIVFRSVLVPLKAALGFLLTMASTFGAVVAIFQWGWFSGLSGVTTPGPILSILPIFMTGVIFGLAMDYEVFLVTRMREEHVHGAAPTAAVVDGFRHGARVVSAAAIIMIGVFASFALSPDVTTKSLGFVFAFGIAIDAFVVRMTVVPAVMVLLGGRAWWLPSWLERVVPRVDIEGAGLRVLDEAERSLERDPLTV